MGDRMNLVAMMHARNDGFLAAALLQVFHHEQEWLSEPIRRSLRAAAREDSIRGSSAVPRVPVEARRRGLRSVPALPDSPDSLDPDSTDSTAREDVP